MSILDFTVIFSSFSNKTNANWNCKYLLNIFQSVKPVETEPHWDQLLCLEQTCVWFMQVKFTKISYIGILFKVRFI
jgi:hypothetical protein